MSRDRNASINTLQSVAALVGITLGVLPLIGLIVGRGPGLWAALIGDRTGSIWWLPAGVVMACTIAIAALERTVRR